MSARLMKLPEVAEQIGKTPRWLRDHLRRHPIGRCAGRDILFTEADLRCLIASLPFELPQAQAPAAARVVYPGPWRHNQPKASASDSVVYFIRSGDYVKIGTARNVMRRYAQLQIAHPEPLDLLLWVPGGGPVEAALHTQFQADRVRGEWFRYSDQIRAWIVAQRDAPR